MVNDNKIKSINGLRSKAGLVDVLVSLQDSGAIRYCVSNYRCGYPGTYTDQFFAPFRIELNNGESWLVFSTNTIRSDRLCIQQWNAENIKRIDKNVTKAVVIVPDEIKENEKENREVEKYQEKINSGDFYTAIDCVMYLSDFERTLSGNEEDAGGIGNE